MARFEFTAVTSADCELAWKVFTNIILWRRFSDVYGDIEWRSGTPWVAGSRLKIEIIKPFKTTVDHVITLCSPPNCIAWIDHFMGNTMEQWVLFEALEKGGTRVRTWAELTGSTMVVDDRPVATEVEKFITNWYGRFCDECNLRATQELQFR